MRKFISKSLGLVLIFGMCMVLSGGTNKQIDTIENDEGYVIAAAAANIIEYFYTNKIIEPFSDTIKVYMTKEEIDKIKDEVFLYEAEIEMLAKVIYRESRGSSDMHRAAVAWVILNRVDNKDYGNTIKEVITSPNQFAWFDNTPILEEHYNIAYDVVTRWIIEKHGYLNTGRILPKDYLFFTGDGKFNYFRQNYKSTSYWNWSLPNVYE